MKFLRSLTILAVLIASTSLAGWTDRERRHSDPGPHPIKILKVVREDNPGQGSMGETRGETQVWLQNTVDADVDKVTMELELWSHDGRFIQKFVRKIGVIPASSKSYQNIRWTLVGEEKNLTQKVWIIYNAGKEPLTQYEADITN